jgi:transcriptional antiterminator NusG
MSKKIKENKKVKDKEQKAESEEKQPKAKNKKPKVSSKDRETQNKKPKVSSKDREVQSSKSKTNKDQKTQSTKPKAYKGRWYVIHTYSGHENKAAAALKQRVETMNLSSRIFEIVVPTRNVVVVRHGKKEETKEKIFPGYILVRMNLDDESWLAVRTTPGITSFVGVGNKPTPIADKEVEVILEFSRLKAPKFKTKFSKGEAVKIVDGPFADFLGTIDTLDEEKGKVKVLVSIFGRETPVELDFLQITKL